MNNLHILPSKLDDTASQIEAYRDLDRQIKALEKAKKEIGDELKAGYFLHHSDFIQDGKLLATYRTQARVSLDQKRFQAELPEVFKEYQTISEVKVFLLK